MAQSSSTFDVVLVDTPAFDSGADTALLARAVGAVLVLARNHSTRLTTFNDVVAGLADSNVQVVGSVLVDVPSSMNASLRE